MQNFQLSSYTSAYKDASTLIIKNEEQNTVLQNSSNNTQKIPTIKSFFTPFNSFLLILSILSFCLHYYFPKHYTHSATAYIIFVVFCISICIRIYFNVKIKKIIKSINDTEENVYIIRENIRQNIPISAVQVGDVIEYKTGDTVFYDARILEEHNLLVSNAPITGESTIYKKSADTLTSEAKKLEDFTNILFQNSIIVSGTVKSIVLSTTSQNNNISTKKHTHTELLHNTNGIFLVLLKFILLLSPLVFIASFIKNSDTVLAFSLTLSVAIGLLPELLPLIITCSLAKGSHALQRKKVIVKNIQAMQTLGEIDTLCIDKTGTLTTNELSLEYYTDILGNESKKVLEYASLTSYFLEPSNCSSFDKAITAHKASINYDEYKKVAEIPFCYDNSFSSVIIKNRGKNIAIIKGKPEEVLKQCSFAEFNNTVIKIENKNYSDVEAIISEMQEEGMKVLAIAYKNLEMNFDTKNDYTLLGYIAFFDSPKKSAYNALEKIKNLHVKLKVLSGDSIHTTTSICRRLGISNNKAISGYEFSQLSQDEKLLCVENTQIFSELNPNQKEEIINILQTNGHSVAYLGDGQNDILAMQKANLGICVESSIAKTKENADIIVLEKDLSILEQGIIEGRKIVTNISKYVRITASSNLGNILSVFFASFILPFAPMATIQFLLLNIFYDILCFILPWDKLDKSQIAYPKKWKNSTLGSFMRYFGSISTIFDLITFAFLYCLLCPFLFGSTYQLLSLDKQIIFSQYFQTGWFLTSLWTQVLIIHLLRTPHISFVESSSAKVVLAITILGIIACTALSYTKYAGYFYLVAMPSIFYVFLTVLVLLYLLIVSVAKKYFIKNHSELI